MGAATMEQRMERIEADLLRVKTMVEELLELVKSSMQDHSTERILSAREVADLLKLDINVIYARCARGEMPYFRMGKLYKFRKSEVLAWIRKQDSSSPFSVDDYVNRYLQEHALRG
jgi:excisionase family DNA binding protein